MKPPELEIKIEQDPYTFLTELREMLIEAGFKVEGRYIEGLDRIIKRIQPMLTADEIVSTQQMSIPVSGSSFVFNTTYADMCWDHEEDD
jgi:hypothetical protein